MPVNPDAQRARARRAHRRGRYPDLSVEQVEQLFATDPAQLRRGEHIDEQTAAMPEPTPEQWARLRRLFNPPAPADQEAP
jgi:hypothetical protein